MKTILADLPDLQQQPELDATLTTRFTQADRERIESAAQELGVPPGRLVRALVRRALAEAKPA